MIANIHIPLEVDQLNSFVSFTFSALLVDSSTNININIIIVIAVIIEKRGIV